MPFTLLVDRRLPIRREWFICNEWMSKCLWSWPSLHWIQSKKSTQEMHKTTHILAILGVLLPLLRFTVVHIQVLKPVKDKVFLVWRQNYILFLIINKYFLEKKKITCWYSSTVFKTKESPTLLKNLFLNLPNSRTLGSGILKSELKQAYKRQFIPHNLNNPFQLFIFWTAWEYW